MRRPTSEGSTPASASARRPAETVASSDDRLPLSSSAAPPGLTGPDQKVWTGLVGRRSELEAKLAGLAGEPMAYLGKFVKPEETSRLHRGDPTQPREKVAPPTSPRSLHRLRSSARLRSH